MSRTLLVAALVVVIGAAALIAYGGSLGGPPPSPSPSRAPSATPTVTPTPIRTMPPTIRPTATPIDTSVRAAAIVIPQRSADLTLALSGVVAGMYVRDQEHVVANQILLKLDQSTYLAEIDVAEAAVRRAEAAVEREQLILDQLPPDASQGQVESAEAELRLVQADLELARSTLAEAQVAIRQTEIRAPFAGTVAAIAVELGEQAVAGQPLVTIGDIDGWLIETTDLSELEVVRVAVGDTAIITFAALPGVELTGRVDRIQVRGTTSSGGVRFAVVVRPLTHVEDLRWNMSATLRITPSG